MKQKQRLQIATVLFVALAALLALNACSGVIGGQSGVRIAVDGLSGGRFIAAEANSGYVVVLQEDKVYSVNNFSDQAFYSLVNGEVYIANLPEGDYIFGVVLLDDMGTANENDDDVYGLAIKEVAIKPGFNDVPIVVGPGINQFDVNGTSYDDFFTPEGYSSEFQEDTIIIDINRTAADFIQFSTADGTPSGQIIDSNGVLGVASGSPWTLGATDQGVQITVTGGDLGGDIFTYRIILK